MTDRLAEYAKSLRKNATEAETLLWSRLKAKQMEGIKFRRQQPIGRFIVDFVSFEKRIVVELDGSQHAIEKEKDRKRDRLLKNNDFVVLRFWDNEVFENMEGILEVIRKKCISKS